MENYTNPFVDYTTLNIEAPPVQDQPWTGGYAHLLNALIKNRANNKIAKLKKQAQPALEVPHQKQAVVADSSYIANQILEKNKQDVLARAQQTLTSNIDQNMAIMQNAENIAQQYTDKQAMLTAESSEKRIQNGVLTDNYNSKERSDKANSNLKKLKAAEENINLTEAQRIASNASTITGSIRDAYTDLGQWSKTKKQNALLRYNAELANALSTGEQHIADVYSREGDINNWNQLSAFATELIQTGGLSGESQNFTEEDIKNYEALRIKHNGNVSAMFLDPDGGLQFRQAIVRLLQGQESAVAKKYYAQWQEYLRQLRIDAETARRQLKQGYDRRRIYSPEIITNDLYFKEGGKVKALKAFLNYKKSENSIAEQEQKRVSDSNKDFHNRASRELTNALKSLDQQRILLLKTIFS